MNYHVLFASGIIAIIVGLVDKTTFKTVIRENLLMVVALFFLLFSWMAYYAYTNKQEADEKLKEMELTVHKSANDLRKIRRNSVRIRPFCNHITESTRPGSRTATPTSNPARVPSRQ